MNGTPISMATDLSPFTYINTPNFLKQNQPIDFSDAATCGANACMFNSSSTNSMSFTVNSCIKYVSTFSVFVVYKTIVHVSDVKFNCTHLYVSDLICAQ